MSLIEDKKSTGILFSAPMVRAILDDRKSQTRRVVKRPDQVLRWLSDKEMADYYAKSSPLLDLCPYGKAGDRLWVRETWFNNLCPRTPADGNNEVYYRADGEFHQHFPEDYMEARWTPSIHMPRWASRITLEITGVRVERLNDITPTDACEEGIFGDGQYKTEPPLPYPVATFKALWESINGAGSWDANPWVWCISFKRV